MGKVQILSNSGEGFYTVNIILDNKTILRVIDGIEKKIAKLDNQIAEIKTDIAEAEKKIKESGGKIE